MKLTLAETKKIAIEVADLVDIHGWTLSAAKAEFKSRTGGSIKTNSKDVFTNTLRKFANK